MVCSSQGRYLQPFLDCTQCGFDTVVEILNPTVPGFVMKPQQEYHSVLYSILNMNIPSIIPTYYCECLEDLRYVVRILVRASSEHECFCQLYVVCTPVLVLQYFWFHGRCSRNNAQPEDSREGIHSEAVGGSFVVSVLLCSVYSSQILVEVEWCRDRHSFWTGHCNRNRERIVI